MEITSKFKEREHLLHHHHHHSSSPLNSPNTNNGNNNHNTLPITRSDPTSPYPTTFVTADTSSFKQVVQMLTGSSETTTPKTNSSKHIQTSPTSTNTNNNNNNTAEAACSSQQAASARNYIIPPIKTTQPKKQGFKLYERRNSIKHLISPLNAAAAASSTSFQTTSFSFSPRHKQEILSPSLLDFPSLTLSPVTPLVEDPFDKSSPSVVVDRTCCGPTTMAATAAATSSSSLEEQEDKAIAEKGFYLHPSPISTPRDSEPQLLPLFPLESPRVSET